MDYLLLKTLHQTAVALSLGGFAARFAGGLSGARWVQGRAARRLPHVVDSVLLLSALALLLRAGWNPFQHAWLGAKLAALPLYIVLGAVALRPTQRPARRALAGIAALGTAGYIAGVALTKSALGPLAWLTP